MRDSDKNMSTYADQNRVPVFMHVRLEKNGCNCEQMPLSFNGFCINVHVHKLDTNLLHLEGRNETGTSIIIQ